MSRENPYSRLKRIAMQYAADVNYRRTKSLMHVVNLQGATADVRQRVIAADQLGWEVIVTHTEQGLQYSYREKPPTVPWELRE